MGWRPILLGEPRARALEAIAAIASVVRTFSDAPGDPSLAGGAAGKAVLYAYLAQAELGGFQPAEELLGAAVDAVAERPMRPDLYAGFTGIAWAVEHLRRGAATGDAGEDEDPNAAIDEAVLEHVSRTPWPAGYDLIGGLVGFGVYALERVARPTGRRMLEEVVSRLDELKVPMARGVSWLTSPHLMLPEIAAANPQGYYNAGLAHGVPGVIALLGAACDAGVAVARARPLLDEAVAWMLSLRKAAPDGSEFPTTIAEHAQDRERKGCRAAWCYGDPGVAVSLLQAARAAREPEWEGIAVEVGLQTSSRPMDACGVIDAGLCHGGAGLAHIYNRMYQATGDDRFREAAVRWLERTLAMRRPGEGLAGWLAYHPIDDDMKLGWGPDPGLLTGVAGIGLALCAAVTPIEPRWDRMLLTSVPPQ